MQLTILHLSDIHIANKDDDILARAHDIASTTYELIPKSDALFILVTGDIASTGEPAQFAAAIQFLSRIKEDIEKEGCPLVDIFVTAGNHDCRLLPEIKARTILISKVIEEPDLANDKSVIDICTESQTAFFDFQSTITNTQPTYADKLWTDYEIPIGSHTVAISAVNASWMSRIPEEPGQLVFPIEAYEKNLSRPSALRFALIHHPLNWYGQKTYHPLRRLLRTHATAICSGHEHVPNAGALADTLSGESTYFEAPSLQPCDNSSEPGYQVIYFDLGAETFHKYLYRISTDAIESNGPATTQSIRPALDKHKSVYALTREFNAALDDPGANFAHPSKDKLTLDDIFIFPDLQELPISTASAPAASAETILNAIDGSSRLILLGDEKSGKTTTLLYAFRLLYARGMIPLLIRAKDVTNYSERDFDKMLSKSIASQYRSPDAINRSEQKHKVALVDDIDRIGGGPKAIAKLLLYLEKRFPSILVTADTAFEVTELVVKDAADALAGYRYYKLLPFGHQLRLKLIKKWCLCGAATTNTELDLQIHPIEEIVNSVIGRNLVPPKPFYLLILLQSCEQQQQVELQNSSFAYYYQYLITKSLKGAGVKPDQLNELFNYIAQLAWFYRASEAREASTVQLRNLNATFSDVFTKVDFADRLRLLQRAKILTKKGDFYKFSYDYIYYFFLGKYLADNLYKEEIKQTVIAYCGRIHKRENANAILFLSHHVRDPWVIGQIEKVLRECLSDVLPIRFDNDINFVNDLINEASQLTIRELDIEANQEKARKLKDEIENRDDEESEEELVEQFELLRKWRMLLKTAEILGQVLKSYYGSIEKPEKRRLLKEVFDGPLRLLMSLFVFIDRNRDALLSELEDAICQEQAKDRTHSRRAAQRIAFDVLGLASTGMIVRTASYVSSEKLTDDIRSLVDEVDTTAYHLVLAACSLMRPGRPPIDDLQKLVRQIKDNVFAFTILQSLGAMHLHLFHMDEDDKQRLCALLDITLDRKKAIEVHSKPTKMLK